MAVPPRELRDLGRRNTFHALADPWRATPTSGRTGRCCRSSTTDADGHLHLPDGPGVGIELDPDKIRAFRRD
jgi:L-alanine-DL-glutamate epimerase-like enolase superfamily enzyme